MAQPRRRLLARSRFALSGVSNGIRTTATGITENAAIGSQIDTIKPTYGPNNILTIVSAVQLTETTAPGTLLGYVNA